MARTRKVSGDPMQFASRYLLPLELYMAVTMIAWGWSGWASGGVLCRILSARGEELAWGLSLCIIGVAQLIVAGVEEFSRGRRWPDWALQASVSARFWASFCSVAVWVYACYMIVAVPGMLQIGVLPVQVVAGVLFGVWVCLGNLKIRTVLDPELSTEKLERTIITDRNRLLGGR